MRAKVDRLRPATTYAYVFVQGGARSTVGTFTTAPYSTAGSSRAVRDLGRRRRGTAGPNGKPGFNRFKILSGRMAGENNAFNINLGDTIYSDSEIGGSSRRAHRRREVGKVQARARLAGPAQAPGLGGALTATGTTTSSSMTSRGQRTATRSMRRASRRSPTTHPAAKPSGTGALSHVPLGKNLGSTSSTSAVPERQGDDDVQRRSRADRTSGRSRRLRGSPPGLRTRVPGLSRRDRRPFAHDAGRPTVRRLHKAIRASKATWKVIVNEVPIEQFYALPYDRWEGYAAERERLLRFLQANVKNVVFLATDTHDLVNEVRYRPSAARRRVRASGRS